MRTKRPKHGHKSPSSTSQPLQSQELGLHIANDKAADSVGIVDDSNSARPISLPVSNVPSSPIPFPSREVPPIHQSCPQERSLTSRKRSKHGCELPSPTAQPQQSQELGSYIANNEAAGCTGITDDSNGARAIGLPVSNVLRSPNPFPSREVPPMPQSCTQEMRLTSSKRPKHGHKLPSPTSQPQQSQELKSDIANNEAADCNGIADDTNGAGAVGLPVSNVPLAPRPFPSKEVPPMPQSCTQEMPLTSINMMTGVTQLSETNDVVNSQTVITSVTPSGTEDGEVNSRIIHVPELVTYSISISTPEPRQTLDSGEMGINSNIMPGAGQIQIPSERVSSLTSAERQQLPQLENQHHFTIPGDVLGSPNMGLQGFPAVYSIPSAGSQFGMPDSGQHWMARSPSVAYLISSNVAGLAPDQPQNHYVGTVRNFSAGSSAVFPLVVAPGSTTRQGQSGQPFLPNQGSAAQAARSGPFPMNTWVQPAGDPGYHQVMGAAQPAPNSGPIGQSMPVPNQNGPSQASDVVVRNLQSTTQPRLAAAHSQRCRTCSTRQFSNPPISNASHTTQRSSRSSISNATSPTPSLTNPVRAASLIPRIRPAAQTAPLSPLPNTVRLAYIRRQGVRPSTTNRPSGRNCGLCKRDLSYTVEAPISQPVNPPPCAVLACGHHFHAACLQLITPDDQANEPPCVPCALGEIVD